MREREEGLGLHSFWQKVKQVKEEEQPMDAEGMTGDFTKGEAGAGFCKVESSTAVKIKLQRADTRLGMINGTSQNYLRGRNCMLFLFR